MSADYQEIMDRAQIAARSFVVTLTGISAADLQLALMTIERAESFGSLLDPTGWIHQAKTKGLERQRALLLATTQYLAALTALFQDVASAQHAGTGEVNP